MQATRPQQVLEPHPKGLCTVARRFLKDFDRFFFGSFIDIYTSMVLGKVIFFVKSPPSLRFIWVFLPSHHQRLSSFVGATFEPCSVKPGKCRWPEKRLSHSANQPWKIKVWTLSNTHSTSPAEFTHPQWRELPLSCRFGSKQRNSKASGECAEAFFYIDSQKDMQRWEKSEPSVTGESTQIEHKYEGGTPKSLNFIFPTKYVVPKI